MIGSEERGNQEKLHYKGEARLRSRVPPPLLWPPSVSAMFARFELIYLQLLEEHNDVLGNELISI